MAQKRNYPVAVITAKAERSLRAGHPWVYSDEILSNLFLSKSIFSVAEFVDALTIISCAVSTQSAQTYPCIPVNKKT